MVALLALSAPHVLADDNTPYYSVTTIALSDGSLVEESIIAGPPRPPAGYALERAPVTPSNLGPAESKTLAVPAYGWSFGCSATSGAMIAAYYDRTGFPNIYTGPTGGGIMPLDSSSWGVWIDGHGDTYRQCPLTASRSGLDGRTERGSLNDYWVSYLSGAEDPYITGSWTPHTWSDAIGDYMRTSQSAYSNDDGSTVFYNWSSSAARLTCADMVTYSITRDGTYGRKLFYEARGHTVTDCYNQKTDNSGGGFTFTLYKAEINAGRPVMLNLAGHTVVGIGYDDSSNTVYLHDTWDYATHAMTWGGSYSGMALQSVSIVNFVCSAPAGAGDLDIARVNEAQVALTWSVVAGADHYEVWSAVDAPYFTPGSNCGNPAPFGCALVAGTSFTHASPAAPGNTTTYAVRAVSVCGAASSPWPGRVGEFKFNLAPGG